MVTITAPNLDICPHADYFPAVGLFASRLYRAGMGLFHLDKTAQIIGLHHAPLFYLDGLAVGPNWGNQLDKICCLIHRHQGKGPQSGQKLDLYLISFESLEGINQVTWIKADS